MTDAQRRRLARPVRLIYWLILLGGLALFTATHDGDGEVTAALWTGAIGGTLLGQYLALHDFRLWIAALVVAGAGLYVGPLVPSDHAAAQLWYAFVPAALCGFWSLGDRGALAAVWFPIVIWMLSILDRSDQIAPDGPAAILLGGLAGLFICFLCLRESRRVALWRSVAAEPLAPARPTELLREPPGRQLARAGWWLSVGALTVAITVWLVPPLWQSETLGGPATQVSYASFTGLPCCPVHSGADTHSARVKEYLDLGLGHDEHTAAPREDIDCRACDAPASSVPVPGATTGSGGEVVAWSGRASPPSTGTVIDISGEPGAAPPVRTGDAVAPDRPITQAVPAPWSEDPWSPPHPSATETAPLIPPVIPDQQAPSPVETPSAPPSPAPPLPQPAPAPTATPAPPAPPPPSAIPPPPAGATGRPTAQSRAAAHLVGPSLLHWLAFAVVAAVVFQVVRLGLRPFRRLVALRHLRRPFWDETIAQRVSNAWQLALVGLRDAGWRTGPSEPPRELARRVHVDGLDRCATILERARHGVGLDAGDLAQIQSSADTAYRAARTSLGGLPRVLAWLRWPLT
jgi:hypothetical protein